VSRWGIFAPVDSPPAISPAAPWRAPLTHLMYALHTLSIVAGAAVSVLGMRTILFGAPSALAVIIGLLTREPVRGTWLGTHFDWQLRTMAWAAAFLAMATLAFGSILVILVQVPLLQISWSAIGAWTAWRLARGWLALRDGRAIQIAGAG
jgi:uncharacterized membrane protein